MATRATFIGAAAPPTHSALGQPPSRRRRRHATTAAAAAAAAAGAVAAAAAGAGSTAALSARTAQRRSRLNAPRCQSSSAARTPSWAAAAAARAPSLETLDSRNGISSSKSSSSRHEEMFLFDEEMRHFDTPDHAFEQLSSLGGVDDHGILEDHRKWMDEEDSIGGIDLLDDDDDDDDDNYNKNNEGGGDGDFLLDVEQAAEWTDGQDHGDDVAERMLRAAGYAVVPRKEAGQVVHSSSVPPAVSDNDLPSAPTDAHPLIKYPQLVGSDMLLQFARKGHAALRALLPQDDVRALASSVHAAFHAQRIDAYRQALATLLSPEAAAAVSTPEEAQKTLDANQINLPFLQLFNLHTSVPEVERIAKSSNLGRIAAELLGVDAVRLYQDSAFWKRSGDGPTPWHTDLKMAPIDTNDFVTFFIPLRALSAGRHAPSLRFASGSHRDVAAAFWFNVRANDAMDLSCRYTEESHGALALGDATAHHGWTLHASPAVPVESRGRMALTISYVSASARVLPRNEQKLIHTEDSRSYARWIGSVKAGKRLRHDMLPIVYSNGTGP